ncbi:MAG: thioredoxin-disulfide reductase [Actinobacteria bacterium]|nr:MAG: thioredoxin-disulfide reductase [Actinomycetota bacterium]
MYDVVIIGGGPAGLTAGIYAQRAGLKTTLLEKEIAGGQVNEAPLIDNYPGIKGISGMELANKMKEHALSFSLNIENKEVQNISIEESVKVLQTNEGVLRSKAVIIATGAKPRRLKIKGEEEFSGRGVSYCATCDGPFFKEKVIASIGGGDRALKEGVYLSKIVSKLYLIHRRDKFRGEKINEDKLRERENVELVLNTVPEEIAGEQKVKAIKIKNVKTNEKSELKVDGVFIFVGVISRNEFIEAEKDDQGFLLTDAELQTSVKGVYAAGDCRSKVLRQVATAVGEGAAALYNAEQYIEKNF